MPRTQGSARQEAERLVATVLAMASQGRPGTAGWSALGDAVFGALGGSAHGAGRAAQDGAWATGSAECCVCPLCRVIAGLRDPDPRTAERLATGAGDFAAGVASLLRAFEAATGDPRAPEGGRAERTPAGRTTGEATGEDEETRTDGRRADAGVWAAATATGRDATAPASGATAGSGAARDARVGDDPWASATAAGHDPSATVPRAPRPAERDTTPPAGPAGGTRPRDPWAAATATQHTATQQAGAQQAGAQRAGAGTGDRVGTAEDPAAGTGDDAPSVI